MDTADLCMKLMRADTEAEVVDLLRLAGYWDAGECWRPIGDVENNFGTIGNQQSDAVSALAEKIVNSIDARLTNACLLAGINSEGRDAPRTIRKAVAQLFEGRRPNTEVGGRISEWSNDKATKEGSLITVAATGLMPDKGDPSITIADQGEGQTPDDFQRPLCHWHEATSSEFHLFRVSSTWAGLEHSSFVESTVYNW